jgi:hypothetical protein
VDALALVTAGDDVVDDRTAVVSVVVVVVVMQPAEAQRIAARPIDCLKVTHGSGTPLGRHRPAGGSMG